MVSTWLPRLRSMSCWVSVIWFPFLCLTILLWSVVYGCARFGVAVVGRVRAFLIVHGIFGWCAW